jgi:ribose transport system substrate-binding protein
MNAIKLTGLLVVVALALAACGTSVPSAGTTGGATSAPAAAQPTAAQAPTEASAAATSAPSEGAATTEPAGGATSAAGGAQKDLKDVKILVDMKGPGGGNPFWAAVEKGATEAGKSLGVQVTVLAPPAESDVPSQISQIEDAVAKGVDGIAIAPTDPAALAPVLQKAIDAGVKVVFIDTKGQNEGVTFIGTNNEAGAKLAADYMCKTLKSGDKVAILQGIITQSTGKARADGAHAGLSGCGLNIVAETPAEWDKAKGQAAMEDILTKNPDLKGVFGSNDNMALGAVEAIKNAGMNGKIVVVGFDANPDAAAAILAGDMNASVAQAPANIGKLGVENVVKLIQGQQIDATIDTGTELVTKDNADKYK